jgi:hypothetical protein
MGFLMRSNRDLLPRLRVTTPTVDYNLLKGWLQKSSVQDDNSAAPEVADNSSSLDLNAPDDISLHVIDCVSRSLVRLPTHARTQYVTLSYVWGSSPETHINGGILSHAPPTIKDSITVCQKLGYKYLWVDRYCIPQDDIQERHRQVQHMGTIYRNSALTIVACAGDDPQYGLPGVSQLRIPYPSIQIPNVGHIQRIPLMGDIQCGAWAHRGWTFQEALLSQARLYFTDRQVYYENDKSTTCEVNISAGIEATPDDYTESNSKIYSQTGWLNSPMEVYVCIVAFSGRNLSFPGDAIDAIKGILAVFEQKFQIRHVCGLAFMMAQSEKFVEPSQRQTPPPEEIIPTLQYSLSFETRRESTRCNVFPSWSWAGWTGPKSWPHGEAYRNDADFGVAVELASEQTIGWTEFQARYDTLKSQSVSSIKFIHVQAYLLPILGHMETCDNNVFGRSLDLQNGMRIDFHVCFNFDVYPATDMGDVGECALLRLFGPEFRSYQIPHLLVRKKGTHWERINRIVVTYLYHDGEIVEDPSLWPGTLQTIRLG